MSNETHETARAPAVVVYLGLADEGRAQELAARLSAGAPTGALRLVGTLRTLEQVAEEAPQAVLVIVFSRPGADIGRALGAGVGAQAALAEWTRRTSALLAFARRNRRRVRLIDDATLTLDPERASAVLGFPVAAGDGEAAGDTRLSCLIGQALLGQDPEALALMAELDASSQGVDAAADVEAVLAELAHLREAAQGNKRLSRELAQYKAQLDDRQKEHDAVLGETLALQQKILATREHLARGNAQITQLRQGLEASLSTLNERGLALEALRAEADGLRVQVADKDSELSVLTGRLAQAEGTIRERDATIAAFYNSRSYRLTAPLRWLRAAVRGR